MARRFRQSAAAVVFLATATAGCTRPGPRVHSVDIRNFAFVPGELTVAVGDTVVWSNRDFVPHTATARDAAWDSKSIAASGTWRLVADAAGRREYYCAFHPTMKAIIVAR